MCYKRYIQYFQKLKKNVDTYPWKFANKSMIVTTVVVCPIPDICTGSIA